MRAFLSTERDTAPDARTNGMRVAIASSGLNHVSRGAETWSREAFLALQERGVDVVLFQGSGQNGTHAVQVLPCVRRNSSLSRALLRVQSSFGWRIGLGSDSQLEQTTFSLSLFGRIRRGFDILHTKDAHVAQLFHAAHRRGWSHAKVILNHGTEEPAEFLRQFDYVQHLAPHHMEEAIREGVQIRRHFVMPNFVDVERFAPGDGSPMRRELGIPPEAFVVTCVAAVKRHHKRIDWLLQEVSRLGSAADGRPTYLVIAGSRTDETGSLIQMGEELFGSRIRFLVDLPHTRMPEVYRASDVFALCSLKEMLSNAVLEAMACGVSCVVSEHPVNRWVVGEGGATVDMEQPGALAQILLALQDGARRRSASLSARSRAAMVFSKEVVLAQQLAMYEAVARDG